MKVIDGNKRFNVYLGSQKVYTGNSIIWAFIYKIAERINSDYWVGDTRKYGG